MSLNPVVIPLARKEAQPWVLEVQGMDRHPHQATEVVLWERQLEDQELVD